MMGAYSLDWDALLPPTSTTLGKDKSTETETHSALRVDLVDAFPYVPCDELNIEKSDTAAGGGWQENDCASMVNNGDLVTCRQCQHLTVLCDPPACRIASLKPGALVRALPGYRPVMMPQRCAGFAPITADGSR
jgi:hypothetical protein